MIPKVIHYCWFGGKPKPKMAVKCIASWKKFCPDFEIREWNESNFDISTCRYAAEAFESKKWAFVTDYVRLWALCEHGGIYMDTDVEVTKPLDHFLGHPAFSGFEDGKLILTAMLASEAGNQWIKMLLDDYADRRFVRDDGSYDLTTNVTVISRMTSERYHYQPNDQFQDLGDVVIYPKEWFCPKDHAGRLHITENTHAIHHFDQSWVPWYRRARHAIKVFVYKFLP